MHTIQILDKMIRGGFAPYTIDQSSTLNASNFLRIFQFSREWSTFDPTRKEIRWDVQKPTRKSWPSKKKKFYDTTSLFHVWFQLSNERECDFAILFPIEWFARHQYPRRPRPPRKNYSMPMCVDLIKTTVGPN